MSALTAFKLGFYFAAGGVFGIAAATIVVAGLCALFVGWSERSARDGY